MNLIKNFEQAWPHLEPAVERARQHTKNTLFENLAANKSKLWVLPNSAVVSVLQKYPNGRRSLRMWLAGGNLHELVDWADTEAVKFALDNNCDEMRVIGGRRGWLRALGWRDAGNVAIKDFD